MYKYFGSYERKILRNSYVGETMVSFNLFSNMAAFKKHHMLTAFIPLKRRWHRRQKKVT